MNSVAVYCGSSSGNQEIYTQQAQEMGRELARRGLTLVYGGGCVGLMGTIADAVLAEGGKVIGVIPGFLADKELAHKGCTELHVVETMHQRKLLMADLAEGFVAMPGGFGTLEELFEVLTWGQLGLHGKPVGLLNIQGFYDALLALLDHMSAEAFLRSENRGQVLQNVSAVALLDAMAQYKPQRLEKWLTPERS
ncbi:TIGR00730 family Rossman fold protein [Hymenobacter sp. HMF4947]|uniref:Cytokinin riboside 5'-monophosphate phosphoribohydrolase n=1 Tax=Hymenobacter ginkgonis TaxID=2682976 RepID=A0A7K1TFK6_9BACT|nr:TIGR00730 family Rossman fold protein [Hymenobacter ginkgonis]MVN76941.1 TIGR00730 family Rossman fold protein [Hymenobacter ginkgonis]